MTRRASICFIAPGHTLLSTAGSTRNILATADALSEWADVLVVFRNVAERVSSPNFRIEQIEPGRAKQTAHDDVAARGLNPLTHLSYLRRLREYAAHSETGFDLVLEKGWRLSGYLCREYAARGIPTILLENDAKVWNERIRSPRGVVKLVAHVIAQRIARHASRHASLVVAETDELKVALMARRQLSEDRVKVVSLGVDHSLFRPMDQAAARSKLGLSASNTVMLYVGGMDQYHDLAPLLQALYEQATEGVELHFVGDGEYRLRYESMSAYLPKPVIFHGQVEHENVPDYIAAADVCLAPYQTRGFHNNQVAFSTLKIPEYMACGRPVISVPSGNITTLIDSGVTGFLFNNDVLTWRAFLKALPGREKFAAMGRLAALAVAKLSWRETARQYLKLADEITNMSLYVDQNPDVRPTSYE